MSTRRDNSIAAAVQGQRNGAIPEYNIDKEKEAYPDDPRERRRRQSIEEGEIKYKKLGWQRLTVCLIVEAIALGSLSLPSVFAAVGMIAGVLMTLGIGLTAIYTGYLVGQVKIKHPQVEHYADAVGLIWGKFGYELASVMFVLQLILVTGSHVLTGTIAFIRIVDHPALCALIWGVLSAILLWCLAIPPSFHEFAVLGYIDFVSIIVAILITMVATGIESSGGSALSAEATWSLWPPEGITFYSAFVSTTNIVFAYSFAVCQYSFMAEMHTPTDYMKSIWLLGGLEILIYTLTGAIIYAFVGSDVNSPALLSVSNTVSRVAFGIALPVIFISGSINSTVVGRYILGRAFKHSEIRYTNTTRGWIIWLALLVGITAVAFIIAEAIPFFSDLLGLVSSLFLSGFSFYFPALFWFYLLHEGKWYRGWKNQLMTAVNVVIFLIGIIVLGAGVYSCAADIEHSYKTGQVSSPFTCSSDAYLES